jgi:hypothetical protein
MMMPTKTPAVYTDKQGTIHTTMINTFRDISIVLDGTVFMSRYLEDFEPVNPDTVPSRFTLDEFNCLTDCKITCKFPLTVWKDNSPLQGWLHTDIHLPLKPAITFFYCSFELEGVMIEIGKRQEFEGIFDTLKTLLPPDLSVRCCYTCQYADYFVAGSQVFGDMICFKKQKQAYLQVKNKEQYMDLLHLVDTQVQEVYLCEEFESRGEDIGYRG